MQFKFIEFNPRRAMRGVRAARVEVLYEGNTDWVWMNVQDIRNNINDYGPSAELDKALAAYKKGGAE